jgi:hypothetical protein
MISVLVILSGKQQYLQIGKYLHLWDGKEPRPGDENHNYLCMVQTVVNVI